MRNEEYYKNLVQAYISLINVLVILIVAVAAGAYTIFKENNLAQIMYYAVFNGLSILLVVFVLLLALIIVMLFKSLKKMKI
ncbi:MAG: hypothetical protein EAZ53_10915 [Bacteroidetes bacterium]|nr:MAG: hypothetical protein EAZ53_10915 [Bacteroidota bacterium]